MTRAKHHRAQPGLRGLVVKPDADGDVPGERKVYPWSHVDRAQHFPFHWFALDEEGKPLRENGRAVRFDVRPDHARNIALAAQRRWMRRAFENGRLAVTERLHPIWYLGCLGVAWLLCAAYLCVPLYIGSVRLPASDEWTYILPEQRILFWIIGGVVLGGLVPLSIVAVTYLCITELTARRPQLIGFQGSTITATFPSGRQHCFTWKDVVDLRARGRLVLADGQVVAIVPCTPRTQRILFAAREQYFPELVAKARRSDRLAPVRLLIWSVLGAVGAGVGMMHALPFRDDPVSPWEKATMPWVGALAVLGVGGLAVVVTSPLPGKLARRSYRRKRRERRGRGDNGRRV